MAASNSAIDQIAEKLNAKWHASLMTPPSRIEWSEETRQVSSIPVFWWVLTVYHTLFMQRLYSPNAADLRGAKLYATPYSPSAPTLTNPCTARVSKISCTLALGALV